MRKRRAWTAYVQAAAEGHSTQDNSAPLKPHAVNAKPRPVNPAEPLRRLIRSWRQRTTHPAAETAGSQHRDYRLLPAAAAAWVTAALVTRLDAATALFCAAVLSSLALGSGIACLASGRARRTGRAQRIAISCVLPLAAAALVSLPAAAAIQARTSGPVLAAVTDKSSITAELRATSDAVMISPDRFTGEDRFLIEAILTAGTVKGIGFTAEAPLVVIGPASWQRVLSADTVSAAGRLLPTDPGDRAIALLIAQTSPRVAPPTGWSTVPARLRTDFVHLSSEVTGQDGLLPGMVIGDRSTLDKDLEQDMQTTGLTHLTAVSGANCSYLLAFVFLGARALRMPRLLAAALGIFALVGFVILVRPEPSVLRAAVMGGLGVGAVLTGRGRVPFVLLLLAVLVLLTVDPWLNASYAFMLSVTAATGLVLFGPVLADRLACFMPRPAAVLLAVPIAAQLFCAPILALLQPTLALYSVPANIAATPVVPMVTILGMAAVALAAIAEPLAVPLVLVAGWGAHWVGAVATFFSAAPGAAVPWVGGPAGAFLTGALSLGVVGAVVLGPRVVAVLSARASESTTLGGRTPPDGPGLRGGPKPPAPHSGAGPADPWHRTAAMLGLAAIVVISLVAVIFWVPHRQQEQPWHIAACDVGQGDAFALRTGEHQAILIDTGPAPDDVAACLDRLSVSRVELLVLTHLHADHYGGIEGVFRNRIVDRILYSSSEPALPSVVSAAALSDASQGVVPEKMVEGMQGEHGGGDDHARVSWTVIWPASGKLLSSENNSSAVLEVLVDTAADADVSVLFAGDLEEDAARAMLSANPDLAERGVHILKVAHHGAQNGGLQLARTLKPRLALISAGRDNEYGHPHPSITAGLSADGIAVARTDLLGTFLVSIHGTSLQVRRSRPGPLCRRSGPWHS